MGPLELRAAAAAARPLAACAARTRTCRVRPVAGDRSRRPRPFALRLEPGLDLGAAKSDVFAEPVAGDLRLRGVHVDPRDRKPGPLRDLPDIDQLLRLHLGLPGVRWATQALP